jgi:hypothetical protein
MANKEDDEAVYKVIVAHTETGLTFLSVIAKLRWHPHNDMRRLDKSLGRLKRLKKIRFVDRKTGWVDCLAV